MEENLILTAGLTAELLLVIIAVFAVMLRRSRKAQRLLLSQLADKEQSAQAAVVAEIPPDTPVQLPEAPGTEIESPQIEPTLPIGAEMIDVAPAEPIQIEPSDVQAESPDGADGTEIDEFDQLLASIEDAKLTVAERSESKERVLQHAQKLRGDIVTLRDRLKGSEGDVQRLQAEKAALAAEYEALNKEYERIYASGQ